ncbi:MAG TPA: 5-deoxy-glucuronate isomerase [Polyangia bacterium]|jgi:5-deoxy-glucuronate isomerase
MATAAAPPLDPKKLVFPGTTAHRGRAISVSPANSALERLCYGRILLGPDKTRASFATEGRETALIVMRGACSLTIDGERHELGLHDAVYVPRGRAVEVESQVDTDIVECSSEVDGDYPLQIIRYSDIAANPKLKFRAGGAATSRDLNIVIGDNVKAGRLMAGFTRSQPGHWTSWPPHEHTALAEELYVYFDMPAPAFGIQLVYTRPEAPELAAIVREGDAVLMPAGYHPNVSAPGHGINFIWMMAARREGVDRRFGVVNVQPGFDQAGSGLEASQK